MRSEIIGRDDELAAIETFLAGPLPATLLIRGVAGAGKTTLWREALARASGYRVLSCVATRPEKQLAFVGLADLLREASFDDLPAPQRRSLDAALLRAEPDGTLNPHAVAAGALGALLQLARDGPLLVAIDDVQWLDAPSAAALAFAARRLGTAPVAVLIAWRSEGEEPAPLGLTPSTVEVGPLSLGAIHRILHSQLDVTLTRPTLRRVHETSGGNPFFALELGRALVRRGAAAPPGPLDVPSSLTEAMRERLGTLPSATREALLAVAAEGGSAAASTTALDPAVEARILERDGLALRFSHPLLASTVYAESPPAARRAMHRRLANAARGVEQRARHLSLATVEPDDAIAAEVARGGESALARGAPAVSAELFGHAVRLTRACAVDARFRRAMQEADAHYEAGDARHARRLLEGLVGAAAPGRERGSALCRLGDLVSELDGPPAAVSIYHAALAEAGDDAELQARSCAGLALHAAFCGDAQAGPPWARRALAAAERAGGDELLARVTAMCLFGLYYAGEEVPDALLRRALELESRQARPHPEACASSAYGDMLMDRCELDAARDCFTRVWRMARDHGDETSETGPLFRLAMVELLAGRWEQSSRHADLLTVLAQQSGVNAGWAAALSLLVDAHLGRVDAVRAGLATAEPSDQPLLVLWRLATAGFFELSLGRAPEAAEWFERWERQRAAVGVEDFHRIGLNAAEALVEAGRLDEAAAWLDDVSARAPRNGKEVHDAVAGRAGGLLRAARGDLAGGTSELERALAAPQLARLPFEHARTLYTHGAVLRRARQIRAAREALEHALAEFDRLGALLWAERARAELARLGGRAPRRSDGLTETERRVAALAAKGQSNKQIAAELFLSVHTVEANLTRIYSKLGVRGRTELASRRVR